MGIPDVIPIGDCVYRGLYRLHSRNLSMGVFDPTNNSFLGIREKFGSRFVDSEYHWENGAPHGTARPEKFLDILLPQSIVLKEYLGSFDDDTGRPVAFERPVLDGGSGWYFTDTGEVSDQIRSHIRSNKPLYEWLEEQLRKDGQ